MTLASLVMAVTLAQAVPYEPVRLPSGEPLVCAYFFTRWWEPWRTSDERILADLHLLRELGVNAVLIDHEPSQMYDGNWSGLDRDHRLAREAGMPILPWLEAKCGKDASVGERFAEVKQRWDVTLCQAERQDGTAAEVLVWHPSFTDYLVAYMSEYIERYTESGAILRVVRDGRPHRVVSPCVELGWERVSFDDETNERFRRWLAQRYTSVDQLNGTWGTKYASFTEVDPRDAAVFDYGELQRPQQPPAVEDHCRFRAEVCRDALRAVCKRLKERYPDVLCAGELPYEFGYTHPHALGYRWEYAALPTIAEWADLLVIRTGGEPTEDSLAQQAKWTEQTGIPIILTHRISARQGPGRGPLTADLVTRFASQAARFAQGLGYYSWNEMVDTHIAPSYGNTLVPPEAKQMVVSATDSAWLSARVARINQAYLGLMGIASADAE